MNSWRRKICTFLRRKTKSEKERRKISFGEGMRISTEEKKNREEKVGKLMEKGNILCEAKIGGKHFDAGEE